MNQEQYDIFRKESLKNATALVNSAKTLTKPSTRHIAYHLAGLALEEIGKLAMVGVFTVASSKRDVEVSSTPKSRLLNHTNIGMVHGR